MARQTRGAYPDLKKITQDATSLHADWNQSQLASYTSLPNETTLVTAVEYMLAHHRYEEEVAKVDAARADPLQATNAWIATELLPKLSTHSPAPAAAAVAAAPVTAPAAAAAAFPPASQKS